MLHIFRAGCSNGTASLKTKLRQQLMAMMEEFLLEIFLDLHKAYADLDRYICL